MMNFTTEWLEKQREQLSDDSILESMSNQAPDIRGGYNNFRQGVLNDPSASTMFLDGLFYGDTEYQKKKPKQVVAPDSLVDEPSLGLKNPLSWSAPGTIFSPHKKIAEVGANALRNIPYDEIGKTMQGFTDFLSTPITSALGGGAELMGQVFGNQELEQRGSELKQEQLEKLPERFEDFGDVMRVALPVGAGIATGGMSIPATASVTGTAGAYSSLLESSGDIAAGDRMTMGEVVKEAAFAGIQDALIDATLMGFAKYAYTPFKSWVTAGAKNVDEIADALRLADEALETGNTALMREAAEAATTEPTWVEKMFNISPDIKNRIRGKEGLLKEYFDVSHARNSLDTMPTPYEHAANYFETATKKLGKTLSEKGGEIGSFREGIANNLVPESSVDEIFDLFKSELDNLNLSIGNRGIVKQSKNQMVKAKAREISLLQDLHDNMTVFKNNPTMDNLITLRDTFSDQINFAKQAREVGGVIDPMSRSLRHKIKEINKAIIGDESAKLLDEYSDLVSLYGEMRKAADSKSGGEFLLRRVLSMRGRAPRKLFNRVAKITGIDLMDHATMAKVATDVIGNDAQKSLFRQGITNAGVDVLDIINTFRGRPPIAKGFNFVSRQAGRMATGGKTVEDVLMDIARQGQNVIDNGGTIDDAIKLIDDAAKQADFSGNLKPIPLDDATQSFKQGVDEIPDLTSSVKDIIDMDGVTIKKAIINKDIGIEDAKKAVDRLKFDLAQNQDSITKGIIQDTFDNRKAAEKARGRISRLERYINDATQSFKQVPDDVPSLAEAGEILKKSGGFNNVDNAPLPAKNFYAANELSRGTGLRADWLYQNATEKGIDLTDRLIEFDNLDNIAERLDFSNSLSLEVTGQIAGKTAPGINQVDDLGDIPKALPPSGGKIAGIPDELQDLAREARKFDNVEDFVRSFDEVTDDSISEAFGMDLRKPSFITDFVHKNTKFKEFEYSASLDGKFADELQEAVNAAKDYYKKVLAAEDQIVSSKSQLTDLYNKVHSK